MYIIENYQWYLFFIYPLIRIFKKTRKSFFCWVIFTLLFSECDCLIFYWKANFVFQKHAIQTKTDLKYRVCCYKKLFGFQEIWYTKKSIQAFFFNKKKKTMQLINSQELIPTNVDTFVESCFSINPFSIAFCSSILNSKRHCYSFTGSVLNHHISILFTLEIIRRKVLWNMKHHLRLRPRPKCI